MAVHVWCSTRLVFEGVVAVRPRHAAALEPAVKDLLHALQHTSALHAHVTSALHARVHVHLTTARTCTRHRWRQQTIDNGALRSKGR